MAGLIGYEKLAGQGTARLFDRATVVNLRQAEITDTDLIQLTRVKGLERLNLSETRITDQGLEYLEGLAELKALDLSNTKISGRGLKTSSRLGRTRIPLPHGDGYRRW